MCAPPARMHASVLSKGMLPTPSPAHETELHSQAQLCSPLLAAVVVYAQSALHHSMTPILPPGRMMSTPGASCGMSTGMCCSRWWARRCPHSLQQEHCSREAAATAAGVASVEVKRKLVDIVRYVTGALTLLQDHLLQAAQQ
jgi:hypothetical protein